MAILAAQCLGVQPHEFHSYGDEEEEVNSPSEQDVQDGSFAAPHP